MSDSLHKGVCACGKVRFEASGEPYRVGVCHCLTCRKAHGVPFNFYAVFPTEAVTVTGDVIEFASSEHARRYSCASCGAPVYFNMGTRGRALSLSRIVRRDRSLRAELRAVDHPPRALAAGV